MYDAKLSKTKGIGRLMCIYTIITQKAKGEVLENGQLAHGGLKAMFLRFTTLWVFHESKNAPYNFSINTDPS